MSDQRAYDRNQRAAERQHDLIDDLGKRLTEASVRDAQEAIKIALLINAGAAVAILAFISSLASRASFTLANLEAMTNSLYWFLGGIILSGMTAAFAYVSNSLYAASFLEKDKLWEHPYVKENTRSLRNLRRARYFNWVGFILAWVALFMFIVGVYVASRAMANLIGLR